MDRNTLRKVIEDRIANLEGNAFQDFCDRLGLELHPGDYQPVRPGGSHGDTKNDGYCPTARIFFAAHATRGEAAAKTKVKIKGDLEGCLSKHRDVRVWRYLTNDTLTGEVDAFLDNDLCPAYPLLQIEVWGHKRIADEICKLSDPQIEKILDLTLASPSLDDTPVVDLIDITNNGGPNGHFAVFAIKNVGTRTALRCRLSVVGDDGYVWNSVSQFRPQNLDPQRTRTDIQLRKQNEKIYNKFVPNLRVLVEYEDTAGNTIFTARELVQRLVPSGLFYDLELGTGFTPPTVIRPRSGPPPIQVQRDAAQPKPKFQEMASGVQLWRLIENAHSWQFGQSPDCTDNELDLLAGLLDTIKDWGEVSGDMDSLTEIRRAQHSLDGLLKELENAGFALFARRESMIITGGVSEPGEWYQVELMAVRKTELATEVKPGR